MTEAIIERLRSLDLSDGGSHLSAIASCFYQPTFGWTGGSCEILRDLLIEILEGKDDNDDNDHAHAHGCDYGHPRCDQHQVSYDELDNERHKAVCELRNVQMDTGNAIKKLAVALGLEWNPNNAPKSVALLQSRIIHLLGGDEQNFTEIAKTINLGDKSDSVLMENGENHKFATITDELRKFKCHIDAGLTPETVLAIRAEINAIADRIDAQFDRICEQNETVLQATIDSMCEEQDRLQERLRAAELGCDANHRLAEANAGWCDDLVDLLRDASREYKDRHYWKQVWHDRAVDLRMERDELRRSLRQIAERAGVPHDLDLSEYGDKKIANAVIGQLGETKRYVKALEWVRDRRLPKIEAKRDELLAKLDDYDKTHVELPKDENGEYIHIGDVMDGYGKTIEVVELRYERSGWVLISKDGNEYANTFAFEHHHDPTVEQVIRDLTLGKITEAQAIERIESIHGQG